MSQNGNMQQQWERCWPAQEFAITCNLHKSLNIKKNTFNLDERNADKTARLGEDG